MYKLKEEVNMSKFKEINKQALICELGFYIGTKKEIDEYIKKNIIFGIKHNTDEYIVFYMFCEFVVEKFFDSEMQDIYDLIDYNYIRLVSMFLNEKCEVVMEENVNLLDKINNIADEREYKQNMKDTENIKIILNTYKNLKSMFEKFDKDIELIQVGVNRGVLKFNGGVYDTELYKKFSANCISHNTGFVNVGNNKFGLGKFGGGCCGEVGILYKNNKLFLTTSNYYETLLELNDETTENDILNCYKVKDDLKRFAEYCSMFSNSIDNKLNNFEEYVKSL